ncbi:MAG: hypothetical protein A2W22_04545 [Candidatus Levybacteria bacterium RBG_16_35_11]|nr:MAG: hypothetical protein A2W22_04545 [Candidatus Levybacteria bacterium RBG_16_35_11]
MTREEAFNLLTSLIRNPSLIKHHLACEEVMKALANYFKEKRNVTGIDENKWAIAGLLHDADYDITRFAPEKHTIFFAEKYGKMLDPDVLHAIKAHNVHNTKIEPKSQMDWSLYCCDELTGLIIACAMVYPRGLAYLSVDFVMEKFDERNFAKGADRKQIRMCEEKLGIPLKEFIEIALSAMQNISLQLGFFV